MQVEKPLNGFVVLCMEQIHGVFIHLHISTWAKKILSECCCLVGTGWKAVKIKTLTTLHDDAMPWEVHLWRLPGSHAGGTEVAEVRRR